MRRSIRNGVDLPLALPARALWLALGLVLAVLFISDLRAPLGALSSIPYVIAVVLSLALPRGYEPVVVAASCTAITVVSLFFAPEGTAPRSASVLHTGLPVFVVWATAWLALRYRRAGQAVRAADAQIQLAALAAGLRHVRLRSADRDQPLVARGAAHSRPGGRALRLVREADISDPSGRSRAGSRGDAHR